jgi:hypothetical protein
MEWLALVQHVGCITMCPNGLANVLVDIMSSQFRSAKDVKYAVKGITNPLKGLKDFSKFSCRTPDVHLSM